MTGRKRIDMSTDEFRQLMLQGIVTAACPECGYEAQGPTGEHKAVDLIAHFVEVHGYDEEEARHQNATVSVFVQDCPRCGEPSLYVEPARNSISRADNRTFICEACGTDESIEQMATGKVTPRAAWPVPGRHAPERHGFQTPDWRDQRSNRAHRPNPVPVPKELPDLRLHLLERWVQGGVFDRISRGRSEQSGNEPGDGDSDSRWERQALRNASLWWIKDDMVDLTTAAAPSIPAEVTAGEIDLPAEQPYGLAVLEKPWFGIDADNEGGTVEVNAVLWGMAMVEGQTALTFSLYRYFDFAGGMDQDELRLAIDAGLINEAKSERIGQTETGSPAYRLTGGAWVWLGRSDWQLGETITEIRTPHGPYAHPIRGEWDTELRRRSIEEDRRWFASLCVLVNHRLSESEPVFAVRQTRRRAERAGVERQVASTVRIIRLRQAKHEHPDDDTAEHKQVEWTHRWLVGSHMAWRRCGPKRSQRKLVFIAPYVKGPADKPLVIKDNVRVWVK